MENTNIKENNLNSTMNLSGKYLTFQLINETYGIDIKNVKEIIQMQKVTPIPNSYNFIRGIINLRGSIVPVIELKKKFNLAVEEDTEKTAIIVMKIMLKEGLFQTIGIVIDEVKEVVDISSSDIEPPPDIGININNNFIAGIYKHGKGVIILLDIIKIFTEDEKYKLINIE